MQPLQLAAISLMAVGLGGCPGREGPATVTGACDSFPQARYAYKGKAKQDQLYIDKSIAVGVAVCNFPHPLARPATWDGPTHTVGGRTVPVPVPPSAPKATFWERFKGHRP